MTIVNWLNALLNEGAVVFLQEQLTGGQESGSANLGTAMALARTNHRVAVGVGGYDSPQGSRGGFQVYTRSGDTWTIEGGMRQTSGAGSLDTEGDYRQLAITDDGATIFSGISTLQRGTPGNGFVGLWTRSGTTWTNGTSLTASDGAASDGFGGRVVCNSDGSIVAISAWNWEGTNTNCGAVYIFTGSGGVWTQRLTLNADAYASELFGIFTAMNQAGTRLFIGSNRRDATSTGPDGKIRYYTLSGSGASISATLQFTFTRPGGSINDGATFQHPFTNDAGDVLVAGADTNGNGEIYTYDRVSDTEWTHAGTLSAPSGSGANWGGRVVLNGAGDVMVVGQPAADSNQGRMWVYKRIPAGNWTLIDTFAAKNPAGTEQNGWSLQMTPDLRVITGAVTYSSNLGRAMTFDISGLFG